MHQGFQHFTTITPKQNTEKRLLVLYENQGFTHNFVIQQYNHFSCRYLFLRPTASQLKKLGGTERVQCPYKNDIWVCPQTQQNKDNNHF